MENTNGYKREGVQKVCAGRFDTSKSINSNGRDRQNENIRKLGNSCSGQLKIEGGERKAEKTEKNTEEKEDDEVRAEKTEKTTEEDEEVNSEKTAEEAEEEEEEERRRMR